MSVRQAKSDEEEDDETMEFMAIVNDSEVNVQLIRAADWPFGFEWTCGISTAG